MRIASPLLATNTLNVRNNNNNNTTNNMFSVVLRPIILHIISPINDTVYIVSYRAIELVRLLIDSILKYITHECIGKKSVPCGVPARTL